MFPRKVDIKTFSFKKINEHLKTFIFSQKCFIFAGEAFLQI